MKRQVWCVDEIRDILMATNEASGMSAALMADCENAEANKKLLWAYRQGFKAALVAVAIALGLSPLQATFQPEERVATGQRVPPEHAPTEPLPVLP